MTDIIPFGSSNLPAFLKQPGALADNDLLGFARQGFKQLSIKGKQFAIVANGEYNVLKNPKDPDSVATYVDAVIIKAAKKPAKTWYMKGYQEGVEQKAPDCFSNDGERPDATSAIPQSKTCALCKHNQFGSRINEQGQAGKGKACSDVVRIAVAAPDMIGDPMLLRVPPASIRPLGEYGKELAKRGAAPHMVVTRIGFDPAAPSPKLTFKPIGFVSQETFNEVTTMRDDDLVQQIIGVSLAVPLPDNAPVQPVLNEVEAAQEQAEAPAVSKSKDVEDDEIAAALAKVEALRAKKEAKTAPAVKAVDLDLSNLEFDDE